MRLVLALLLLAACGDPLANGDFVGDAKLSLDAIVCGTTGDVVAAHPKFGIFWKSQYAGALTNVITNIAPLETTFPANVQLEIFDPPPTSPPTVGSSEGFVQADVGCPALFDDIDDDGIFDHDDRFLAVSWSELIVYVHGESRYRMASAPYQLDVLPQAGEFGLYRGTCDAEGQPSGGLVSSKNDHPLDVHFLSATDASPSCVRFF